MDLTEPIEEEQKTRHFTVDIGATLAGLLLLWTIIGVVWLVLGR